MILDFSITTFFWFLFWCSLIFFPLDLMKYGLPHQGEQVNLFFTCVGWKIFCCRPPKISWGPAWQTCALSQPYAVSEHTYYVLDPELRTICFKQLTDSKAPQPSISNSNLSWPHLKFNHLWYEILLPLVFILFMYFVHDQSNDRPPTLFEVKFDPELP